MDAHLVLSPKANDAGRKTVGYQPTVWTYDFLLSLQTTDHACETDMDVANALEQVVRNLIEDVAGEPSSMLALIDDVQRLGLGHRFETDIKGALERYYYAHHQLGGCSNNRDWTLYVCGVSFRLLRQHGFQVSQDIFKGFVDDSGKFLETQGDDIQGVLSLYEASFLAIEGEDLLEEARAFATKHLQHIELKNVCETLTDQVIHALEEPLHRRVPWEEAWWYVESYKRRKDGNPSLLELAVLNFNIMQSQLKKDLQCTLRWWDNLSLVKKLNFARDRPMESFFLMAGIVLEPQFSYCRKGLAKLVTLITVIDDIYDIYGTINELELFTDAVCRWDVNAVNNLPHYMKLCFLVLYNFVHEMAYDFLKEQGDNIIPYLKQMWADICKVFLKEALWNHNKIIPTFQEYLDNGDISATGFPILIHAFFLSNPNSAKYAFKFLEEPGDLLRSASILLRLSNDLATFRAELERGESANSIICYMAETGASEELAQKTIRKHMNAAWTKMNEYLEFPDSKFPKSFVQIAFNFARVSVSAYRDEDSFGAPSSRTKKRIHELLLDPISLPSKGKRLEN